MRFLIADVMLVVFLILLYFVIRKAVDGVQARKEANRLKKENAALKDDNSMWVESELRDSELTKYRLGRRRKP